MSSSKGVMIFPTAPTVPGMPFHVFISEFYLFLLNSQLLSWARDRRKSMMLAWGMNGLPYEFEVYGFAYRTANDMYQALNQTTVSPFALSSLHKSVEDQSNGSQGLSCPRKRASIISISATTRYYPCP